MKLNTRKTEHEKQAHDAGLELDKARVRRRVQQRDMLRELHQ